MHKWLKDFNLLKSKEMHEFEFVFKAVLIKVIRNENYG